MKAWQALHVLSPQGCFPFAKKRNGTVLGEGAGILVLEEYEHAKRRGAKILAELSGFGMASDSQDMVEADRRGTELCHADGARRRGHRGVFDRLSQRPRHGDKRQRYQRDEGDQERLQERGSKVAISSTKSMTGHPLGAGGGIEAVVCVKTMEEGWVPPTIGLDEVDPECDLDYVPNVGRNLRSHTRCRIHSLSVVSMPCWCSARRLLNAP